MSLGATLDSRDEEAGALQNEAVPVPRLRESEEEALDRVLREREVVVLTSGSRTVEQSLQDGGREVRRLLRLHDVASM